MALRTRVNNAPASLQVTTAWSPALAATGAFLTTDQLSWGAISAANSAVNMGGNIDVSGTGGGIRMIATQVANVSLTHTSAANISIGTLGVDTSLNTAGWQFSTGVNATMTFNQASTPVNLGPGGLVLNGPLAGSGGIAVSGSGTMRAYGTGTSYSGAITVAAGATFACDGANGNGISQITNAISIALTGTGTLLFNNAGGSVLTFNPTITSAASSTLRVSTPSNITFNNASGFIGGLSIANNTGGSAGNASVTFSKFPAISSLTLDLTSGGSGSFAIFIYTGTTDVSSAASINLINLVNTPFIGNHEIRNASASSSMTFSGTFNYSGTNPSTFRIGSSSSGTTTVSSVVRQLGSGVVSVAKTLTGSATLTGANTFTGTVSVSAGTLNANSATALGADQNSGTVTSGATLSLGAALNYSTRTFTINSTGVTVGGVLQGAVTHAYAGTAKIGAITLGSASYVRGTQTGTLSSSIANGGFALTAGAASGNTLTLTGGISGLGGLTVGFYSSDTGTVALTTSNSYSGNTTLSTYGTLSLGNASALGTSTLIFSGGTLDASTDLTAANALTVSNNITFTGTAALTLSSAVALGASRTVTVNGSTLTLSGVVSGASFKLTKAGAGVLKLTNTNTYSGGTDIGGTGTVQAGAVQALGSTGTVTMTASTATLQTLTTGGQNGKLTVAALTNSAGGTIKIGG